MRYALRGGQIFVSLLIALLVSGSLASAASAPNESTQSRLTGDPEFERQLKEAERETAERRKARQSAKAREERRQSRGKHRGLSREEALNLARRRFPSILEQPVWRPLALRPGQRLERYVGSHSARVEEDGKTFIAKSRLPMTTSVAGETPEPVDLSLERHEKYFAPANPLAKVRFGKEAAAALTLPRLGVGFRPAGEADREATLTDDRVFYPSVQQDTDFVVMPVATGAETFWMLRSPEAPEALTLNVDLPVGAVLRVPEPKGGRAPVLAAAEIVRGGEVLSWIMPPSAQDADGHPVGVKMDVEDDRLVLYVEHRSADLAYPLAVDPVITEEYHAVEYADEAGRSHGNQLWYRNASFEQGTAHWWPGSGQMGDWYFSPHIHGGRHFSARRWPGSGDGWIWYDSDQVSVIPGNTYKGNFYARPEWGNAPAQFRAEILFRDQWGNLLEHHFGPLATENHAWDWKRSPMVYARAPWNAHTAQLRMVWESRDGQWHNADMASLEDTTNWSEGTGWWREDTWGQPWGAYSGKFAMPLDADAPLWGPGVYVGAYAGAHYNDGEGASWQWRAPAGAYIKQFSFWNFIHNEDGTLAYHGIARNVPRTYDQWQSLQTDDNWVQWGDNQGRHHYRHHEQDSNVAVFGMQMQGSYTRSRGAQAFVPEATIVLGDVHAPRITGVWDRNIPRNTWTRATRGEVDVAADDYGLGLYNFWLEDENGRRGPAVGIGGCGDRHWRCPGYWSGALSYTHNGADLPEGINTFRARTLDATDNLGESGRWQVKVDRTRPEVELSDALAQANNTVIGDTGGRLLHIVARDESTEGRRAGVASLQIKINGVDRTPAGWSQTCDHSCSMTRDYLFSESAEGTYRIQVTAVDQAGNRIDASPVVVTVDRTAPRFTRIEHSNLPAGWVKSAGPSVFAEAVDIPEGSTQGGSGIRALELLRNGAAIDRRDYGCAGTPSDPCALTRSTTFAYGGGTPDGINRFAVRAHDGLRAGTSGTWPLRVDSLGPELRLTGTLKDAENTDVDQERYSLRVDAVDGIDGGTDAQQRSGVKRIRVLVNGTETINKSQETTRDSLPLSTTYDLVTDRYSDGPIKVRIEATDVAGNVSAYEIDVMNTQYESCLLWADDEDFCRTADRESENATQADDPADTGLAEPLAYVSPSPSCLLLYGDPALCTDPAPGEDGFAADESGAVAAAAADPLYGLGDENPAALASPAVAELKVRRIKKILPYDVVDNYCLTADCGRGRVLDNWIEFYREARRQGMSVMVVFERTQRSGSSVENANDKPSVVTYRRKIQRFIEDNPKVRRFGTWNEPNHKARQITREGKPAGRQGEGYVNGGGVGLAAKYANELIKACRDGREPDDDKRCDVVIGEMGADPDQRWAHYFDRYVAAIRALRPNNRLDGLKEYSVHPYGDIFRKERKITNRLKAEIAEADNLIPSGSQAWITEGGSRLDLIKRKRTKDNNLKWPTSAAQLAEQKAQVQHYFDEIGQSGVRALLYYNICEPLGGAREDDGFLEPAGDGENCGAKRPAWTILKNRLNP